MMNLFAVFTIWRIAGIATAYFSSFFLPYLGHFSHPSVLRVFYLPFFIKSFANFDGIFYIRIARDGYSQFEHAFFPLYPLLIKLLTFVTKNFLVSGLIISNVAFFIGIVVFKKLLKHIVTGDTTGKVPDSAQLWKRSALRALAGGNLRQDPSLWIIIFLLTFPTSFFFGAVYTEGLFFLFAASCFYFLHKDQYFRAGVFAYFASLTRFAGIFLIIPFLVQFFLKRDKKNYKLFLASFFPVSGLLTYSFYLQQSIGDPLAFLHVQPAFGAGRSIGVTLLPQVYFRYAKILFTTPWNFQYFVALLEVGIFSIVLAVLVLDFLSLVRGRRTTGGGRENFRQDPSFLLGMNLFSFANLLVPTLTGTFLSIPRFALLSLPFFLFLGQLRSQLIKISIAVVFTILHVILLGFFIRGYFVS